VRGKGGGGVDDQAKVYHELCTLNLAHCALNPET